MGKGGDNSVADQAAINAAEQALLNDILQIYERLRKLESLRPCALVNSLFTQLVRLCTPPSSVDVRSLSEEQQVMRSSLICICGEAEGLLERHYAQILGRFPDPLCHVGLFPYYPNYEKLALLEYSMLKGNAVPVPRRLAFVGSGPLPLTSLVLATKHMPSTCFDNYDLDPLANEMARRLVAGRADLARRMAFHSCNVMHVTGQLAEYEVVFLAALVGVEKRDKLAVLRHLAKYMAPGAVLLLRSAHGARGFLYPVVDDEDLEGFEPVSVVHPTDEVINSVVLARKR
ncbi:hypothetical protein KI387_020578 [Taxus chinensis]|uniref:Nicotianamine synthase n=1 Tax=Taxus chinensis TaxID=29808 RepID=A0AA38GBL8_TAXCH|nr:hypothetical protein KI387_020578 [Taxus chinensis]